MVIGGVYSPWDIVTWRGSYHFYDKSSALPGQSMCIMPKVGKKNLSFFLLAINEILNEIAVANYDNFSLLSGKDMIVISLLFITFRQGYHCDFISPG
jgi:hypothetical protein